MKEPESVAPSTNTKLVLVLVILQASFMAAFLVMGYVVYSSAYDRLRSELRAEIRRELLEIQKLPEVQLQEDNDQDLTKDDTEDKADDDSVVKWFTTPPPWMPQPASDVTKEEPHPRLRRASNRGTCRRCCRACDSCSRRGKPKRKGYCKACCSRCKAHDNCKEDKQAPTTRKPPKKPTSQPKPDSDSDNLFESRLGHFIGSKKIGRCHNKLKTPAGSSYALTVETGNICAWDYAAWMKKKSRSLYRLNPEGKVIVTTSGLYYIYGQLVFHDPKPTASSAIMIRTGKDVRELAKCIHTAGPVIGAGGRLADPSGSFRTCSMGAITQLGDGAEVYLAILLPKTVDHYGRLHNTPVDIVHNANSSFFGMIKFK